MAALIRRPPDEQLRGFLLGTLSEEQAEYVAAWVDSMAAGGDPLRGVAARDTLIDLVTTRVEVPDDPAADRVVESLVAALRSPAAPHTLPESGTAPWLPNPGDVLGTIGRYRIVRELGRGGMGVLYEAVDDRLRRRVAVKVLNPTYAADPVFHERFIREGRAAAAVTSEYVVGVYEADDSDRGPFLAMQYVDGPNLEDWLKDHSDPASALLRVGKELLAGLAAVHARGLVHRDVKPQNVIVERATGRIKLVDFGLTRDTSGGDAITRAGFAGTLGYMAPEQAEAKAPDPRSDLFSVGVVLYRVVAGRSPFLRDSPAATLLATATETPAPLGEKIPAKVNEFVFRLLAKNPADRPADARAALVELEAIQRLLASGQTAATLDPPPPRPRSRRLIAAGLAALAATVAAVVIISIKYENGKERFEFTLKVGETPDEKKAIPPVGSGDGVTPPPPVEKWSVVVTKEAVGYADETTDSTRLRSIPVGATGEKLGGSMRGNRVLVRLDDPAGLEVWIYDGCLKRR
jgi:serine/threonine protein kinase